MKQKRTKIQTKSESLKKIPLNEIQQMILNIKATQTWRFLGNLVPSDSRTYTCSSSKILPRIFLKELSSSHNKKKIPKKVKKKDSTEIIYLSAIVFPKMSFENRSDLTSELLGNSKGGRKKGKKRFFLLFFPSNSLVPYFTTSGSFICSSKKKKKGKLNFRYRYWAISQNEIDLMHFN